MEEFLGKKYVLISNEHFEDYLSHIGVGYFPRKLALSLKPVQTLTVNDDGVYNFTFSSALASYAITFRPGEEFVEVKPDGSKTNSLVTIEGNKLIHTQTEDSGRTSTHVREFFDDHMVTTTTVDGLNKTAIRRYAIQQ